ncbi:peptidase C39 family protein [Nocardioides sp. AE5]|uniref:peptidase C39 family protein n=1 Tax=Nocardioides sp. AE5 TaxID=2962573 RepID=UPI0028820082|nr:peptidase C39 family protein [Nocardioides sp. AE5]MDT0200844.1 peptidase C39 family protein [Nocardioides sp. AE5]
MSPASARRWSFRSPVRAAAAASALALACVALTPTAAPAASPTTSIRHITSTADFQAGTLQGAVASNGSLRIASSPLGTTTFKDPHSGKSGRYDYGRFTSPWISTGMDATSLIPSWNAQTDGSTFLRVFVRTKSGSTVSSWDSVATWGISETPLARNSAPSQPDDLNQLLTDTLVSNGSSRINAWQVQVDLYRIAGTTRTPVLHSLSAVAATYKKRTPNSTSKTTMTRTVELDVPTSSQMTHRGHFPQWGGGGAAWCSPTSTSMVLRYWNLGPPASAWSWADEASGHVDHAARYTYDHEYGGAGNWPFNVAYAAHYGAQGFVTRLWSLPDAETFIKAGIPIVVSVAFGKGELPGAPISSTNGHLMVIVGFTADGRVIVNDPAAANDAQVRRTYPRKEFEAAWLKGSGGVTYVMAPASHPLPPVFKGRW